MTFWFGLHTAYGNTTISDNDTTEIIHSMKYELICHSTISEKKETEENDILYVKLDTVNDDFIFIARSKSEYRLSINSIESFISDQVTKKKPDQLNSACYFDRERYRFVA